MARYMETARQANEVAKELIALVPEGDRPKAAEMIARLVNLGIRISPRACQHTVRLNGVQIAVRGLPVRVAMRQVTDEKTKRIYNALVTQPVIMLDGDPTPIVAAATVEGAESAEE